MDPLSLSPPAGTIYLDGLLRSGDHGLAINFVPVSDLSFGQAASIRKCKNRVILTMTFFIMVVIALQRIVQTDADVPAKKEINFCTGQSPQLHWCERLLFHVPALPPLICNPNETSKKSHNRPFFGPDWVSRGLPAGVLFCYLFIWT